MVSLVLTNAKLTQEWQFGPKSDLIFSIFTALFYSFIGLGATKIEAEVLNDETSVQNNGPSKYPSKRTER